MVEMIVGLIVMVPVLLFLIDIGLLVFANIANGDLAKSAARSAASSSDPSGTTQAVSYANNAISTFNSSSTGIVSNARLTFLDWNPPGGTDSTFGSQPSGVPTASPGQVVVATSVTYKPPVPFPFIPASQDFTAYSAQPIVGLAPNLPGNTGP